MKEQIINEKDIEEKGNEETKVKNLFSSENPDISFAKVIRNSNDKNLGYDTVSDNFHYVLDGEGICILNGKEHILKKGDFIIIPKGTKYKNVGNLKLLIISIPCFNKNNQIYDK